MEAMNLRVGWIAILGGLLAGATFGMFFDKEDWLGGYGSYRRRMLRLAHISLVGTGLLNLAFALSVRSLHMEPCPRLASALFILGAATMPVVCGLSAWRRFFRHAFFVPVLSLVLAAAEFIYRGFRP
jgi:hypothetical protein